MWQPNQVCWIEVAIWDFVIWRTAATLRRWWKSSTGAVVSTNWYPSGRGGMMVCCGLSIFCEGEDRRCVLF
jgi:hypothetical protein